jgi:hypothetical protein
MTTLHDRAESRNQNQSVSAQKKPAKPFSRARKRLREIERIISRRHQGRVPDTDDVDAYLEPVVNCFRLIAASRDRSVSADGIAKLFGFWCERWAPDVSNTHVMRLARHERASEPKMLADDIIGKAIRLSYAERLELKITTIGSFDADKVIRKKLAADRRRKRDRLRKAEERGAKGATPRANSLSRTEPWKQEGISRRTWERRRKAAAAQAGVHDANSSPHQRDEVDANSSPHRLSYSGATDLRHDAEMACSDLSHESQPPAFERGPPEAAPSPPPRPIVTRLDAAPTDGLILDEDGHEFKQPPPYERRPAPKTWMDAAFEGYTGGRS